MNIKITYEMLGPWKSEVLSVEALRRFARFEISFTELMNNRKLAPIEIPEPYQIIPEDLMAAVENYHRKGISEKEFGDEYFWPLWDEIYNGVGIETAMDGPDDYKAGWIPDQYSVFSNAWDVLTRAFEYGYDDVSLDEVITEVQTWLDNRDKPLAEQEFTRDQKWVILDYWSNERLESADAEAKAVYRKVLDSLCEENDIGALMKKAYACYGNGNAVYGQDWQASQECLLKLMELDPNPRTANTLGYMYYYGRCTDGVPEYDKAFYYFSIGAAGWFCESRYKLADMYRHGYGVAKNPSVVWTIIWELYEEQVEKICAGNFACNFADVALRAGDIWKEGINCCRDPDKALYYYLQAQYAIRMRMLVEDNYGDQGVVAGIDEAIAGILPETSYPMPLKTAHLYNLEDLLRYGLEKRHHMEMKVKRINEVEARLTFRIVPFEDEPNKPKLFVTVPRMHFCGLVDEVTVTAREIEVLHILDGGDTVRFDSVRGRELYLYGRKVAEVDADLLYRRPS